MGADHIEHSFFPWEETNLHRLHWDGDKVRFPI
jgi:hypothetical protein